jgi:D-alanyl-D-alanine carboxypeptidase/D-alanyl-D-alanine-endopeptidase (penicillin-binding protein 4)
MNFRKLSRFAATVSLMMLVSNVVPACPASVPAAAQGAAANTANANAAADPDAAALKLFKPVGDLAHAWLQRPELQQSLVGIEIMDIPSGRVLFSSNGRKRFVCASTAKVFTTACAFDLLGGSYHYQTSFYGYGEIRGGHLTGPMVVIPSQDPSFSTNSLQTMISGLSSRIKAIDGNVYVGQIQGGGDFFATEWLVQDFGQDWMPPSSDFVIDRNVALLKDLGRGYKVTTVGSEAEWNTLTKSLLKGPWASAWVQFNKSNNSVVFHRPDGPLQNAPVVANPTDYNTAILRTALKSAGIKVGGNNSSASGSPIVLAQDTSPPLSEIVQFTLENSDNLYAQQLLRSVGNLPPLNSKLENASLEDRGLARLINWLSTSCGVSSNEAILFDGCGLSRKDAVTPHALNMVLRHMAGAVGTGPYLDLLKHDEGSPRSFRYKTGAMDSVRSISGIARTSTGQPLAITIIINDHTPSVRELKASMLSLVSKIEALGALKLRPVVVQKAAAKRKAGASPRPTRRHRRHR